MSSMKIVVLFGLVASIAFAFSAPASASPYGVDPGGPGYLPDSVDHWFCFDGTVPGTEAYRYNDTMQYIDTTTTMYDVPSSTCGSLTDVIYSNAYPIPGCSGCFGYAPCITRTGFANLFCEQGWAYVSTVELFLYNGGFAGDPALLDFNHTYNVRHEVGHTVGMGHSSGVHALMIGWQAPVNWGYFLYAAHDICHVNWLWGGPTC